MLWALRLRRGGSRYRRQHWKLTETRSTTHLSLIRHCYSTSLPHDKILPSWTLRIDDYHKKGGLGQFFFVYLNSQMLPHHVGIQLGALAVGHHCSLGHHDVLLGQSCGKVEPLFHQQNRETA